ncbi:MAG: ATP-binding cassette domain-containing protein [Prevotella sp.]|nr:ATP-binding cassette domain-containing protein [Prevotella sp.]MBQ2334508.1 ATP-binding cassette domain-containing protein [Prevotella sp.]
MESINFCSVCPQVFLHREDLTSEVWKQNIGFNKGKTYLVEADSGQGKSTFCSYVMGYRHDYEGKILFDQQDIIQYRVKEWTDVRRLHISCLFQDLRLFPELTALENVEIKNQLTQHKSKEEIVSWFERMGIADKMNTQIGLMSFGQQQRVAMIRALVQPFDFILADEPISHLDDQNAEMMGVIMMEEALAQHAGVIVTSIGKHMDLNYDQIIHL